MSKFKVGDRVESKYEHAGKVGTVLTKVSVNKDGH